MARKQVVRVVGMLTILLVVLSTVFGCSKGGGKTVATKSSELTTKRPTSTEKTSTVMTNKSTAKSTTGAISYESETNSDIIDGNDHNNSISDDTVSYENKAFDLNGATVRIGVERISKIPTLDSGIQLYTDNYNIDRSLENEFNCKIEYVLVNGVSAYVADCKANALAGTETRDILTGTDTNFYPWAIKYNYIRPLDDYYKNIPEIFSKCNNKYSTFQGIQYSVCSPLSYAGRLSPKPLLSMAFRRDLFDINGLENPQKLIENYAWTWEKFLEYAIILTQDTNGDGINDQFGIVSKDVTLFYQFVWSNGAKMVAEDENNFKYFTGYDNATLQALQFVSDMFNVYNVVTENYNAVAGMVIPWNSASYKIYDYGLCLMPKGPSMKNDYVFDVSSYISVNVLPIRNNNAEGIFRLLCKQQYSLFGPESNYANTLESNTVNQMVGFTDSLNAEYIWKFIPPSGSGIASTAFVDSYETVGLAGDINNNLFRKIKTRQIPVSSALESFYPYAKNKVDEFYK